jgi:hypothetical protein
VRHPLGRLTDPDLGTFDVPGPPIHAEAWFHARDLVSVRRGQHTGEVLGDELGHAIEELCRWKEQGLV